MTESLFTELKGAARMAGNDRSHLSAHVLCPQNVATKINISERNQHLQTERKAVEVDADNPRHQAFQEHGMTPERCAALVFEAMETGQFYILADNPEDLGYVRKSGAMRHQAILEDGRSLIDGPSTGGGGLPGRNVKSEFMERF